MDIFRGNRDDEAAFRAWTATHPQGFVLNHRQQSTPVLHKANCHTINRDAALKNFATSEKKCSLDRAELVAPHADGVQRCGHCDP